MRLFGIFTTLGLALNISFTSCNTGSSGDSELVLVCGDHQVLLVRAPGLKDTIPDIVWNWNAHQAEDLPAEFRNSRFNSIDDCKSVNGGKDILVSSSSGAVALVRMEDKKVLFYAEVPNAHSIELLPGNKIVAAASTHETGNMLMLFENTNPANLIFTDSLYSAHGVVWDQGRESLFALGYSVLREYKLTGGNSLSLNSEVEIPGIGGHDLQMAPGGDKLFITEHTGAWQFHLNTWEFSKIDGFPDAENIKSINQKKKGRYVYTVPEESWWTYHVSFLNPSGKLDFPDMQVYKARWYSGELK